MGHAICEEDKEEDVSLFVTLITGTFGCHVGWLKPVVLGGWQRPVLRSKEDVSELLKRDSRAYRLIEKLNPLTVHNMKKDKPIITTATKLVKTITEIVEKQAATSRKSSGSSSQCHAQEK